MAHLRVSFSILMLIVFNLSSNYEARILGETNSSPADTTHLEEEKIPPEVFCSLIGGCQRSAAISNSVHHPTNNDLRENKDSSMASNSHLGEEKIPINVICSLLGGCERSATTSNINEHPTVLDAKANTDLHSVDPSHLGEEN